MSEQYYKYAGFWIRAAATIVDTFLFILITVPLLFLIYGWAYFDDTTDIIAGPADLIISWILLIVVIIVLWLKKQATPGKMLFSLKLVDAKTGRAISAKQAIIRYLGYIVLRSHFVLALYWQHFTAKSRVGMTNWPIRSLLE